MSDNTPEIQIDKPDGQSRATIVMDMSQFDLFNLCEARYNMAHNLRKRLRRMGPSIGISPLDRGSLFHEGFDPYYKALAEGKHFDDAVQACILAMNTFAADPEKIECSPEEVEGIISIAVENLEFWRHEDAQLEILAVEESFAYQLYQDADVRILITGKIDLLVNKPSIGGSAEYKNLPIDHKTYSRDGFLSSLSNQFMNYCVATGSNYLVVNRVGLQKTLKPHEKYKRIPLSYDDLKLDQFKDNVTKIILNNYLNCIATGEWKMNFTSCDKFNRKCEYFEICDTSGETGKIWKLQNNYDTVEPWDVTKRLEG